MIILAIPILAQALSFSVGSRGEARVRRDSGEQYFDVQTLAYFRLQLRSPRVQWDLQYAPTYTSYSVGTTEQVSTLDNTGALRCNLRLSPRTTFAFSESVSYGHQNLRLAALASPIQIGSGATSPTPSGTTGREPSGSTVQPSQSGPTSNSIYYASNFTSATVSRQVDRSTGVSGSLSYMLSQGLDVASRQRIPRMETVLASIAANEQLTRVDNLSLTFSGQRTSTRLEGTPIVGNDSNNSNPAVGGNNAAGTGTLDAWIATGSASWDHRFSRLWSFTSSASVSYTQSKAIDGRKKLWVVPGGATALKYSDFLQGGRFSVVWSEYFAPTVDRFSGTVVSRLSTNVSAGWTRRALTFGATSSWMTSVGGQDTKMTLLSAISASEFIAYQMARHWRGEVGIRENWQSYQGVAGTPMIWNAYLAITYDTGSIAL